MFRGRTLLWWGRRERRATTILDVSVLYKNGFHRSYIAGTRCCRSSGHDLRSGQSKMQNSRNVFKTKIYQNEIRIHGTCILSHFPVDVVFFNAFFIFSNVEFSFQVCPVCASLPGGDPNHVIDDFASHLTLEHRSGPRDLISFLDEPASSRHSVRRIPHPNRGVSGGRTRR